MTVLSARWRTGSVRRRVLAGTAAMASVALALAVLVYGVVLDRVMYTAAARSATADAVQAAALILDEGRAPEHVLRDRAPDGAVVQLLGPGSTPVVASGGPPAAQRRAVTTLRPAPGERTSTQVVGIPGDEHDPYALVVAGLGRTPVDGATVLAVAVPLQLRSDLVGGGTALLAVIAVVLLAGVLWLIGRVLATALGRVEDIRSAVAEIEAGDRSVRVPLPPGGDEVTRLAETMNGLLDRLEAADAAQRAFVGDASHELRSPLTTIRMVTEISPQGLGPEDTAIVATEAVRMQRLVDDLLTLAKADDRGLGLERADVDLDDLVARELRRARVRADLQVLGRVDAARTQGDAGRLAQVLRNLVDNALRHARTSVRLESGLRDGWAVVDVDNDGPPVPEAERLVVFDRFARLQASRDRDTGGSGLGLAIVHALVTAHDGEVEATTAPDGWCRFEVRLPATGADDVPEHLDVHDRPDGPASGQAGVERSR